ncbi:MAG: SDR family oxidoreductase [Thermoguttaceae bacterium]|nr:SDR family oxidoreductase [Thermoguttaceae bacterium]MDW8077771.1 SDR family oxidoreductase [Thermoguttaceae bacterium]
MGSTDLNSLLVIVTGGSSGIGRATALAFHRAGSRVAILGRDQAKLEQVLRDVSPADRLHAFVCDVSDRLAVERVFEEIFRRLGTPDVLVNNAGINVPNRDLRSLRPEDWDRMLAVNATGAFNCLWAVLPAMRRRGSGLIVNVVSVSGKRVYQVAGAAYCASKFALAALGLATLIEEKQHGIRVTNIYPGEVNTPILSQRPTPVPPERLQSMLQPEDVAEMILAVARLPARVCVPEIVITPLYQEYA